MIYSRFECDPKILTLEVSLILTTKSVQIDKRLADTERKMSAWMDEGNWIMPYIRIKHYKTIYPFYATFKELFKNISHEKGVDPQIGPLKNNHQIKGLV